MVPTRIDWIRLLRIALSMIDQVNADQRIIGDWSLGGGTGLMLQIDHRDSRDIDIFLADPQLLAFLDPSTRDFGFEVNPADYSGDGSRFLKLVFHGLGEIDFIVAGSLTENPTISHQIDGRDIFVETVSEIVAKKIYFRGRSIKPRDIFDIAAVAELHANQLVVDLRPYSEAFAQALAALDRLDPLFVRDVIAELAIHDKYKLIAHKALDRTKEILRAV